MQPKIALITGINGFLGRNIHEHLNEKGVMVVGLPRELLSEPVGLEAYIKQINPNYIYHCAAYGNHSTQLEFDEIIISNLIKTYSLLRASLSTDYEAFFNISSSSVYGKKKMSMKETDNLEPDNFYACTKAASEFLARPFAKTLGKRIVNIRPFSIYGPYEKDHRLIPTIIRKLINNEHMELVEPPVHDWLYVKDFVEALDVIRDNIDIYKGDSINIGTGRQTSNRQIYDTISDIMNIKTKVRPTKTPRDYESSYWRADITTMKMMGWHPRYSLEQGLWDTIEFYKNKYHKEVKPETLTTIMETTLSQFGVRFESVRNAK